MKLESLSVEKDSGGRPYRASFSRPGSIKLQRTDIISKETDRMSQVLGGFVDQKIDAGALNSFSDSLHWANIQEELVYYGFIDTIGKRVMGDRHFYSVQKR